MLAQISKSWKAKAKPSLSFGPFEDWLQKGSNVRKEDLARDHRALGSLEVGQVARVFNGVKIVMRALPRSHRAPFEVDLSSPDVAIPPE